jgi:hypothetical protein
MGEGKVMIESRPGSVASKKIDTDEQLRLNEIKNKRSVELSIDSRTGKP